MSIGPFNIPLFLIPLFIALTAGYILQRAVFRKFRPARRMFWSIGSDMLLTGVIVWKLAPLLAAPQLLWEDPAAFLYRPGGTLGLILGAVAAVIVGATQLYRKKPLPQGFARLALMSAIFILAVIFAGNMMVEAAYSPQSEISLGKEQNNTAALRSEIRESFIRSTEIPEPWEGQIQWDADYLVINAWASWCAPCRGEIPELRQFYADSKRETVELLGLNLTSTEKSKSAALSFVEESGINYPVLLDMNGEMAAWLEVESLPTTIVIGPSGGIVARRSGIIDRLWLRNATRN